MIQEILVGVTVLAALGYLVKKFFFKKNSSNSCGSGSCGCG